MASKHARRTSTVPVQCGGRRSRQRSTIPSSRAIGRTFFPAFFQALKTERVMMFILLTMIMVVAAFVIVATLIMMIMEKSGDIAILKAMGAEDGIDRTRIFAIEGTLDRRWRAPSSASWQASR